MSAEVCVSVLNRVPLDEGGLVLVEADRGNIPDDDGLTLATPVSGKAFATASESLGDSLERIKPVLSEIRQKLEAVAPDQYAVEFGVKLGGETGMILAKGTAEV